jgi:hypothetical protein
MPAISSPSTAAGEAREERAAEPSRDQHEHQALEHREHFAVRARRRRPRGVRHQRECHDSQGEAREVTSAANRCEHAQVHNPSAPRGRAAPAIAMR